MYRQSEPTHTHPPTNVPTFPGFGTISTSDSAQPCLLFIFFLAGGGTGDSWRLTFLSCLPFISACKWRSKTRAILYINRTQEVKLHSDQINHQLSELPPPGIAFILALKADCVWRARGGEGWWRMTARARYHSKRFSPSGRTIHRAF